ncbi:MAG: hypothetical protein JKX68_02540 [Flavobacteriales bacterium]|nr:hypothetical protein [Flavobacteriales bacterium]
MIKLISRFIIQITLLLGILFSFHLLGLHFLSLPLYENKIIDSYLVNLLLTITIFIILIKLKNKFAESLGYIFFAGSFLKFIVFFILIYPSYTADGDVSRIEFTSFFIPYAISLIFEVTFIIKTLNKED